DPVGGGGAETAPAAEVADFLKRVRAVRLRRPLRTDVLRRHRRESRNRDCRDQPERRSHGCCPFTWQLDVCQRCLATSREPLALGGSCLGSVHKVYVESTETCSRRLRLLASIEP